MRPQVSVIVCAYNAEQTVSHTLDSLLAQTLKSIEITVINDGSTDQTLQVLEQYQKNHPDIVKVYSKENGGIASARNYALTKITGTYFGFLDADDTCEPEMFQDLYDSAEQHQSEVVVSNFYWVNEQGKKLQTEGPYTPGREMMVKLFATLWNKLYRTDFIRDLDIRFPDGNRYEDACFLYCLSSQVKQISFVDHAYVNYMQQGTSITHTNNAQVKNMITVFKLITNYYKDHDLYEAYHDELEYIHIKFFLGNSFLRSSRIEDPNDRRETIMMGWDLLNEAFPNWHHNHYLKDLGGMKNKYFSMVNSHNIMFFAWLFRHFTKDSLG